MMDRAFLAAAAAHAKQHGLTDLAIRYNPVVRYQVSRVIERFHRADLQERRRLSEELTARTIAAARGSDYGRGFSGCYEDWPRLTKSMIRDAPSAFTRRTLLNIPAATAGTTGTPMLLQRSAVCAAAEQTFLDRLLGPDGPSWGSARVAVLRGDAIKNAADGRPPFAIRTHFGRRMLLSPIHLTPENFPWYVEALNRFRPRILLLYPNQAVNLLRLLEQSGRHIQVGAIVTSSEQLPRETRHALERTMGVPVHDFYGQSERVCFASSGGAEAYYFHPAYGRVELPAADWYDAGEGRRAVSIVGTTFWNGAMPLVRYDTGDLAIVPRATDSIQLEEIALGLRPFLGIAGRSDEYVLTPDGLRVTSIDHIVRDVENILQVQIVQEASGDVEVRALVRRDFSEANRGKLLHNIRTKVPPSLKVRFNIVDRLSMTKAGKTPFVIRHQAVR